VVIGGGNRGILQGNSIWLRGILRLTKQTVNANQIRDGGHTDNQNARNLGYSQANVASEYESLRLRPAASFTQTTAQENFPVSSSRPVEEFGSPPQYADGSSCHPN